METFLPLLERTLTADFVPHLPALLDRTRPQPEQDKKNLSRAFSAFAICKICSISNVDASKSVVDDFDDYGIDAIFFHGQTDTLYFIQSKLKPSEEFKQGEALAFCQGIRKLIQQDFVGFNKNVQDRKIEIEDALDTCSAIQLVVAHIGTGISNHAKTAVEELLSDDTHGEDRLKTEYIDYGTSRVISDLRAAKAYERVDTEIWVEKCCKVDEPRLTYFGLVHVSDLITLHQRYPVALYAKNIRTFLGIRKSDDVNTSIQQSLRDHPQDFMYFNNGVTTLCDIVEPKGQKNSKGGKKRLKVRGFSVINGAQTIASSASFAASNPTQDISKARVAFTLIKADSGTDFGKSVTKARNHQNPVTLSDFVALDDEQERLRCDLAHIGIHYFYKAGATEASCGTVQIHVAKAAQALSFFNPDPRYTVWIKKDSSKLLDTNSEQYKSLFDSSLSAFKVANAVIFNDYIQARIAEEMDNSAGQERLIYRHGNLVLAWVLAKRVLQGANKPVLFDLNKLNSSLSVEFDSFRQILVDTTRRMATSKGPLSFYRNQADVIPLIIEIMIQSYGLSSDPVIGYKRMQGATNANYPKDLVDYMISKAPQIGNLS